ncbi:hypothetical protein [Geobacter sp. DSM 9736]|uniref:hypothetical protein n=1 Tax=Geobacter sp. DSM 9736 TaxID=1277350 RepID=UPI000B6097E2|nr:hypothetical protein [Geobacter sp. DSM 9736]SNB44676.1 hypothetical protein SAMN06269301_0063 [Geobacter sp. DSM 9736]
MKPTAPELLERDFIECRSRLLDIAAFLDRLDRYEGAPLAREDFRYRAVTKILKLLASGRCNRAVEILTILSDPTSETLGDEIPPPKAVGAWGGIRC